MDDVSGVGRRMGTEWLDNREWSEGKEITWVDRQKLELAIDRFWMSRGYRGGIRGKEKELEEGLDERVKGLGVLEG